MSDTVIRVENLGKKYTIGQQQQGERYTALRDVIANGAKEIAGRFRSGKGQKQDSTSEDFWALKDVSFEIKQGDRVGIIGRNGAGKSTLLKILSRITEPTTGRIKIRGRVASLLEVGTGFHSELTGRENIFLNGAILGMGKAEINRKFDEIVAFSEVEKFLDTPVKRYSSGMYVRLAFAVAAHLEPEILIVDEVLAVGDSQFQKKCLGKMEDVSREGKTIIFVSHNISTIQNLCSKGILLHQGHVSSQGDISSTIGCYMSMSIDRVQSERAVFNKPSDTDLWMKSATLFCDDRPGNQLMTGNSLSVDVEYEASRQILDPKVGLAIRSMDGYTFLSTNNRYQKNTKSLTTASHSGKVRCELGKVPLVEGTYSISLWFGNSVEDTHYIEAALVFEVSNRDIWGTAKTPPAASPLWWSTQFIVKGLIN